MRNNGKSLKNLFYFFENQSLWEWQQFVNKKKIEINLDIKRRQQQQHNRQHRRKLIKQKTENKGEK